MISVNSYVSSVAVFGEGAYAAPAFDKPVLHSEFHFGTMHRGMFSPGLCALENPYWVGTHWFQYGSQATTGRGDGENYQIGFVDVCDRPYPKLAEAARAVAETMYETRYHSTP